jgi:hypothetical protein
MQLLLVMILSPLGGIYSPISMPVDRVYSAILHLKGQVHVLS